jgi:hypothetical protein
MFICGKVGIHQLGLYPFPISAGINESLAATWLPPLLSAKSFFASETLKQESQSAQATNTRPSDWP